MNIDRQRINDPQALASGKACWEALVSICAENENTTMIPQMKWLVENLGAEEAFAIMEKTEAGKRLPSKGLDALYWAARYYEHTTFN